MHKRIPYIIKCIFCGNNIRMEPAGEDWQAYDVFTRKLHRCKQYNKRLTKKGVEDQSFQIAGAVK